ncbi:hypothetical protein [Klebsiella pneumoniae]|uniref:hypothetical protein n=1 Tax=Klebsiella pneumoniae TaxID=573 RepID=UPI003D2F3588
MWDDVVADPDIATVVRGMKLMDNHYPDLVIALGETKLHHRFIGHQQHAAGGEFVQHREGVLTEANPRFQ